MNDRKPQPWKDWWMPPPKHQDKQKKMQYQEYVTIKKPFRSHHFIVAKPGIFDGT